MGESPGRKRLTIAIDGPTGAGKSTVGRSLARRLGYTYIDTGAMYRAVAWKIRGDAQMAEDETALSRVAASLHLTFKSLEEGFRVFCDGEEITDEIRSPDISLLASHISKKKGVREALVQLQRKMGRGGGVVLEGRDIGTVVFPEAEVKFYLDAGSEERATRRFNELIQKGQRVDYQETMKEMEQRDHNDMNRLHSPLKRAEDAILVDSTGRSVEEVVEEMVQIIAKEGKPHAW